MDNDELELFLPDNNREEFVQRMLDPNMYAEPGYVQSLGMEPFLKALDDLDFLKAHKILRVQEAPPECGFSGPGLVFKESAIQDLFDAVISRELQKDLMSLVKMGLVDYSWSDKDNDFVFSAISKP